MSEEQETVDNGETATVEAQAPDAQADAQAEAPRHPESILDTVEPAEETEAPDPTDVVDTPTNPEAEERPEWLPEKFKTPEDLVKAYNELGGKLREKNEPPETYELELPDGVELKEADAEAFKEMGLNNDQAQKLVGYFYENVIPELQQARADVEVERLAQAWNVKADSTEFQQRLSKVKSWALRNMDEQAVAMMARTHNGVQALYQMMQAKADQNLPAGGNQARPSPADLQAMMADERYVNRDPDYMAHVQRQFQLAYD